MQLIGSRIKINNKQVKILVMNILELIQNRRIIEKIRSTLNE